MLADSKQITLLLAWTSTTPCMPLNVIRKQGRARLTSAAESVLPAPGLWLHQEDGRTADGTEASSRSTRPMMVTYGIENMCLKCFKQASSHRSSLPHTYPRAE